MTVKMLMEEIKKLTKDQDVELMNEEGEELSSIVLQTRMWATGPVYNSEGKEKKSNFPTKTHRSIRLLFG